MACIAYRTKRLSAKDIVAVLAYGFTGQLKGRWDNYLSPDERDEIINHKSVVGTFDDGSDKWESDGHRVLIHTITLYFLGNPKEQQANSKQVLNNLRCPTLSDYRWCRDVFMTYVMKR